LSHKCSTTSRTLTSLILAICGKNQIRPLKGYRLKETKIGNPLIFKSRLSKRSLPRDLSQNNLQSSSLQRQPDRTFTSNRPPTTLQPNLSPPNRDQNRTEPDCRSSVPRTRLRSGSWSRSWLRRPSRSMRLLSSTSLRKSNSQGDSRN
jgi:hypothetical protein